MPVARSADGVEISYRVVGDGQPAVLFMHGWAGSGAYFDETLGHLDLSRLRAITFDFRGHGESARTDGGYTLDHFDDDVLAVADDAGADTFVLVGYSMSGKFAQHLACSRPDRVRACILVAGTSASELPLPPELLADWYGRAGSADRMLDLLDAYLTGPVDPAARERFGREAARAPLVALEGTMDAVCSTSFAERLGAVTMPTLVLGGALDTLFTPEALREGVLAPLPNARLALLDCGHEIPLERPALFAALIEAFLAGLGTRSG